MDYLAALALLVWSCTALRDGKFGLAALLIGLACGFRPTSGAFLLPSLLYAGDREGVLCYPHAPGLAVRVKDG